MFEFPSKFDLSTTDGNDERAESPGSETEMRIACRTIMIGTYSYKPLNKAKVRISSEGVSIVAPRLASSAEVTLQIPLKSFVHVLAHTEHPPAILLYTEAKTGERVRSALGMRGDAGPYFDPLSPEDACKRIALLPTALSRRRAGALRTLFGMVLDELDAPDQRLLDVLRDDRSCHLECDLPGSAPGPAAPVEHPAPGSDSPTQPDEASSSSSVIFPPSPSPISLSSHSSLPSPKSSPTRKRKSRHKKSKSKKMKYVLVKNPESSDVDAFLAGVAPILKGLSPLLLNLAKTDIISAALKYEMRMITENCNGVRKE